eukprot:EG_transcript_14403
MLHRIKAHEHYVPCVAFAPDGALLASCSWDHTLALFRPETGKEVRRFNHNLGRAYFLAWAPSGGHIATAHNKCVAICDAEKGHLADVLRHHTAEVRGVAYAPDGRTLASGGMDRAALLCDVETGQVVAQWQDHTDDVDAVAFSPDGRLLATGSSDRTVRVVEVASGALAWQLRHHTDEVRSVAFAPDGRLLASAGEDQALVLTDLQSGGIARRLRPHAKEVRCVRFSPDGTRVASASSDETVCISDATTGDLQSRLRHHGHYVDHVCFSPDGRLLASSGCDAQVVICDVPGLGGSRDPAKATPPHRSSITVTDTRRNTVQGGADANPPSPLRGLSPEEAMLELWPAPGSGQLQPGSEAPPK